MKKKINPLFVFFTLTLAVYSQCTPAIPADTWSLAVSSEYATVTIQPYKTRYNDQDRVTVRAYPLPGHSWTGWSGDLSTPSMAMTFNIDRDLALFTVTEPSTVGNTWPSSNTVGVPSGEALTIYSGPTHSSSNNQLFSNLVFTNRIYIDHSGVIIKNCKLMPSTNEYYGVYCTKPGVNTPQGGTGFILQNCEVTSGITWVDGFTARSNWFHAPAGGTLNDGIIFAASDVLIEDNLISDLNGSSGAHLDGIQVMAGSNIIIRGNWIEAKSREQITGGGMVTSSFYAHPTLGNIHNLVLDHNTFIEESNVIAGYGYYPLRISDTTGQVIVQNNRWSMQEHGLSLPYRITGATVITVWLSNRYDKGEVIEY